MEFLKTVKEVVFLGPAGSYSEMAKDIFCKHYNLNVKETPCPTISEAIEYVNNNEDVVGVIPVENSIEGVKKLSNSNGDSTGVITFFKNV